MADNHDSDSYSLSHTSHLHTLTPSHPHTSPQM